jgi:hypothetical protein
MVDNDNYNIETGDAGYSDSISVEASDITKIGKKMYKFKYFKSN